LQPLVAHSQHCLQEARSTHIIPLPPNGQVSERLESLSCLLILDNADGTSDVSPRTPLPLLPNPSGYYFYGSGSALPFGGSSGDGYEYEGTPVPMRPPQAVPVPVQPPWHAGVPLEWNAPWSSPDPVAAAAAADADEDAAAVTTAWLCSVIEELLGAAHRVHVLCTRRTPLCSESKAAHPPPPTHTHTHSSSRPPSAASGAFPGMEESALQLPPLEQLDAALLLRRLLVRGAEAAGWDIDRLRQAVRVRGCEPAAIAALAREMQAHVKDRALM
jgi:hypothetical protein